VRDKRRTRVVLVVLLVVAVGLIGLNYADGSNGVLRAARSAGSAIFGGAEHAASSVARFFSGSGSSGTQVQSLQEQVARLRAELTGAQLSKSDYRQLRKLGQSAASTGTLVFPCMCLIRLEFNRIWALGQFWGT